MHASSSHALPLSEEWLSSKQYVNSLLSFISTTDIFRNLCGGVHVLDFLIREPDLYSWALPLDWREWLELVDIHDLLDLLMREDISRFQHDRAGTGSEHERCWKGYSYPPESLVRYIRSVRAHSLQRTFKPVSNDVKPLPRHVAVGMKPKKIHEVANFAAYVDELSASVSESNSLPLSIIDFGSGQNYLGRTLACPPYNKNVIAIEQRHHNVEGAKNMDVHAKLTEKEKIMRNKKEYKRQLAAMNGVEPSQVTCLEDLNGVRNVGLRSESGTETLTNAITSELAKATSAIAVNTDTPSKGSMTYVEHVLESGHLEDVLRSTPTSSQSNSIPSRVSNSLVVSIHSCGNLTHHGLRSITLNPSVQAVAMIGCCYNLLTERLGPPTFKHPQLRSNHPRLKATSSAFDPHGFPMSQRLETFEYSVNTAEGAKRHEKGIRLNITARMMAVQAPYNWGKDDSELFFTRHFYRALLQRILLDLGVVKQAVSPDHVSVAGNSLSGKDKEGTPLIIGSLRKTAFRSFEEYVRAAIEKLTTGNPNRDEGEMIAGKTAELLNKSSMIHEYEAKYGYARKHLAIIWSLMAFSASVVESTIVVDRWLWLQEQPEVEKAWVEAVFGYDESPRNLCVVGVKKPPPTVPL